MDYPNKLLENCWNTCAKLSKNFLQNRRNLLQNRPRIFSKIAGKLAQQPSKNLLKNHPKTCSKLQNNYSKMVENLLQKRGIRNRKDSHSIYRRMKNYARFQPLYGVTNSCSTAILMDTAPFRGSSTAVLW